MAGEVEEAGTRVNDPTGGLQFWKTARCLEPANIRVLVLTFPSIPVSDIISSPEDSEHAHQLAVVVKSGPGAPRHLQPGAHVIVSRFGGETIEKVKIDERRQRVWKFITDADVLATVAPEEIPDGVVRTLA